MQPVDPDAVMSDGQAAREAGHPPVTAHQRAMADDWVYLTDLSSGYGYYANTKMHIGGIATLKADLTLDDPAVSFDIPGLDEDIGEDN